ncbi:unnamed protein product [Cylicocyclus nassatus]|uniref:Uncharacterized protein n=1 Tax=Cylicocyclus nassatus TaxID=53992 RepID=A0AA36H9C5_CYLNA|nr:unnamed protein product [Cylicocyclus nassatus]
MKVAFAILLLACQRLNGNVVRRKDALQEEVYATSENVKKKTANSLNETNSSLETITEDSHIERMSGARKNGTESKEHDDGINHANPNISQLMQHGEIMRTSILQVKNPEDAHYESEEKFDSRMARDTDDDETGEDIDPDNEDNDDGDKIGFKPADPRVVKPDRVPISAEIKEDTVKPIDLHIYVHLSGLGRNNRFDSSRGWERESWKR